MGRYEYLNGPPAPRMVAELAMRHDALVKQLADAQATIADAQATIAALQARVQELEQWVQDQSTANLETMRHTDEMQSRAIEAESQLTQRTAELAQILAAVDEGLALTDIRLAIKTVEETQAELEAANGSIEAARRVNNDLQAELERVRGERDKLALCGHDHSTQWWQVRYEDLAALVAALPKVEGAVVVSNGYVKDSTRCHALFGADEDAASYAALLQHRQGMEG